MQMSMIIFGVTGGLYCLRKITIKLTPQYLSGGLEELEVFSFGLVIQGLNASSTARVMSRQ